MISSFFNLRVSKNCFIGGFFWLSGRIPIFVRTLKRRKMGNLKLILKVAFVFLSFVTAILGAAAFFGGIGALALILVGWGEVSVIVAGLLLGFGFPVAVLGLAFTLKGLSWL